MKRKLKQNKLLRSMAHTFSTVHSGFRFTPQAKAGLLGAVVLSVASLAWAAPELSVELSNHAFTTSTRSAANVYVRIAGPNDYFKELKGSDFAQWVSGPDAADGLYRYDSYTWVDIPKGDMSKQDRSRVRKQNATRKSGQFTLKNGVIIAPQEPADSREHSAAGIIKKGLAAILDTLIPSAYAADLYSTGTTPQVYFDDTDTVYLDWDIWAEGNDGGGYFQIRDFNGSGKVLDIQHSANNSNSFVVDDNGNIGLANNSVFIDRSAPSMGIGTTTPDTDLHIIDDNGIASDNFGADIGLQQPGGPRWEVESFGGDFGINIDDNMPIFKIINDAPSNSLVVGNTGNVGIGTGSPGQSLHILDEGARLLIDDANTTTDNTRIQLEMINKGTAQFKLLNESVIGLGNDWRFQNFQGKFRATAAGTGQGEMSLDKDGNVVFRGTVSANNGANTLPDYVLEPDYKLMPLEILRNYIQKKKHLPNIPSKDDVAKNGNTINMTDLQFKLLEKVEELTLYTLQQQKLISENSQLKERLASLEKLVTNLASGKNVLPSNSAKIATK